jgi:RNA polymerase sigma factor (sigma-70 family)
VVNAAYDEGRRLGRRLGETELTAHHDRATGDQLGGLLERDEMSRAFRRLKPDERTVVALRYYLDLSTADAAAAMGLREVTYRSRLHRAIKALGAALAADARSATSETRRWT